MKTKNYMKPIIIYKKTDSDFPKSIKELTTKIIQYERKQKIIKLNATMEKPELN